ncbi:UbiA family prenyltransferase [Rhodobacteraceae bacterium NNCM2]|nr:UbiA family prenyltransferase [Coraliihabitans acroporae]
MELKVEDAGTVPLVVDLDGTLLSTDLLHESILQVIAKDPLHALRMPAWLKGGKAAFKRRLTGHTAPDVEALPVNPAVIAEIEAAREAGRPVVLVTASDQIFADMVGEKIGLFDEVHGSDGQRNLGGEVKAAFLVDRYGAGGYDYIGDSRADLPVWEAARHALVVRTPRNLAANPRGEVREIDSAHGGTKALMRALRPHQWLKNILIAVPMLTAYQFDWQTMLMVALAFICFSLTASGVYVVNDLLDLPSDRRHPRKSKRPFAAGEVPIMLGAKTAIGLWLASFVIAIAALPLAFFLTLLVYFIATFAYSLFLKKRAIVDICTLAGLYSLRVIAGGTATGIVISPWLLAFAMFFFLALAAIKRQAEMTDLAHTDPTRKTGRPYEVEDLPIIRDIAMAGGFSSVLVMALYINSATAMKRFPLPEALWLICPLLLYWVIRMVMVTHRRRMTDDPIVFALRDKVSCAVALGIILSAIIAWTGL